jgi:hypothetical protein
VGWRRRKRTNTVRGSGLSARVDYFEPTRSDTAPSGPQEHCPATSRLQRSASPGMCSIEVNCLPRQNDSRHYGIGRSTRRLWGGSQAR